MRSNSKRGEILASASYIVENLGMDKLTLEAVANRTGISKGGLLHHFPNKEALIEGMIIEYTDQFIAELTSITSKSNEQGKWIRAYLNVIINDKALVSGLAAASVAAMHYNPSLLDRMQEMYRVITNGISNDGGDVIDSTIVRLAADGLWFSEIYGLGKMDEDTKEKVIKKLHSMINKDFQN